MNWFNLFIFWIIILKVCVSVLVELFILSVLLVLVILLEVVVLVVVVLLLFCLSELELM